VNAGRLLPAVVFAASLAAACGNDHGDLREYIHHVKSRTGYPVAPLPSPETSKRRLVPRAIARDPFAAAPIAPIGESQGVK
jgi:Tfp pilus assembly protein PilP